MPDRFFSSDEYDERVHQLYNDGRYDDAAALLKEALEAYPHHTELHVALGFTRLAREEYIWARRSFDEALTVEPDHEDALAGLGEVLLQFGERERSIRCFERILSLGFRDDLDLVLQIGRALFRSNLLTNARQFFEIASAAHPESAEAAACVGYTAHRLFNEAGALRWLYRSLELDPSHSEARVYLANLLYDRGDYEEALAHFERTDPAEHHDELALWRMVELKKSMYRLSSDDPELRPLFDRLVELGGEPDPTDILLAEVEAMVDGLSRDPRQLDLFGTLHTELYAMRPRSGQADVHCVASDGRVYTGTFQEIVTQMKDEAGGFTSLEDFMLDLARRGELKAGVPIPTNDPETFIRANALAGLMRLDS